MGEPAPRILITDRGDARRRLDAVVCRHLRDVASASRTRVQAWIENGQVAVNGMPVLRVAARVALGDVVSVLMPEAAARKPMAAEDVGLDVLYEDEHLLALDKPAGVIVHPAYKHTEGTVMNALLWHARDWSKGQRPSIVGRLDKLTSGIVIVAKTAAVHAALQRAMGSSDSEKDYLAVVYGRVNVARGEIDLRLALDRRDRRRVVASATDGAPSVTRFERLARVAAPQVGLSLLRCRLATGRRHQIRVHLSARGWPLVGDPTYGQALWSHVVDSTLSTALRGFSRQALHAWRVSVTHPITRERLVLEAPAPADFQELLAAADLSTFFESRLQPDGASHSIDGRATGRRMTRSG